MEINWCFIIPLLVGLVSAILGYLLGRLLGKGPNTSTELNSLRSKNSSLQADLDACHSNLSTAQAELSSKKVKDLPSEAAKPEAAVSAAAAPPLVTFDGASAKAAYGKPVKQDDLTIIEGIGPKIQELFHNFDIKTWKKLSETSVARCQEVLDSGGPRFRIHTPETWPNQAQMAYEGRWAELKKWQDENDYGKIKS